MTPGRDLAVDLIGNDWSLLVPDEGARWHPSRTVSICIPTRNPGEGLRRTLRCLAAQTYPHHLIEVVVCDDGSDVPVDIDIDVETSITYRVVRQELTLAFGAGRARNTAARAAEGNILFFLDADVIPERRVVEAYARWFEGSRLSVPMGLCRFVDVDGLSDDQLFDLVNAGEMAAHFAGQEVDDQGWRERHFERTDDLRREWADAFRITIGATLAVTTEQFHAVGGFRELGVRGVEDTEFGYRLHRNGGVLILDRDAQHWHQGRRNLSTDRRAEIDRVRAPFVDALIPISGFRRLDHEGHSPVEPVPVLRVHVRGHDESQRSLTRASLCEVVSRDLVVVEADVPSADFDPAVAHVVLDAGVVVDDEVTRLIRDELHRRKVGVIRAVLDVPEDHGREPLECVVVSTRAWRRVVQTCDPEASFEQLLQAAASRFGVWWADGTTIGLRVPSDQREEQDVPVATLRWRLDRMRLWFRRARRRMLSRTFDVVVDLLKRWS